MTSPRPHTKDEIKEMLFAAIRSYIDHWSKSKEESDRMEGLAFSILNILDGTSGSFPCAIDLVMRPHQDDKQYLIDNEENYTEDGMVINDNAMLHEEFCK